MSKNRSKSRPRVSQNTDGADVSVWLKQHKLEQYACKINGEGYHDLETLLSLDDEELIDLAKTIGMMPSHNKKLLLIASKCRLQRKSSQLKKGKTTRAGFTPQAAQRNRSKTPASRSNKKKANTAKPSDNNTDPTRGLGLSQFCFDIGNRMSSIFLPVYWSGFFVYCCLYPFVCFWNFLASCWEKFKTTVNILFVVLSVILGVAILFVSAMFAKLFLLGMAITLAFAGTPLAPVVAQVAMVPGILGMQAADKAHDILEANTRNLPFQTKTTFEKLKDFLTISNLIWLPFRILSWFVGSIFYLIAQVVNQVRSMLGGSDSVVVIVGTQALVVIVGTATVMVVVNNAEISFKILLYMMALRVGVIHLIWNFTGGFISELLTSGLILLVAAGIIFGLCRVLPLFGLSKLVPVITRSVAVLSDLYKSPFSFCWGVAAGCSIAMTYWNAIFEFPRLGTRLSKAPTITYSVLLNLLLLVTFAVILTMAAKCWLSMMISEDKRIQEELIFWNGIAAYLPICGVHVPRYFPGCQR